MLALVKRKGQGSWVTSFLSLRTGLRVMLRGGIVER